ncbi:Condensin complex subunit 3 [Morella rubra]|uniref:Condensin complex subunit 3 n=1 Tax=Morella rubra TaxID=262757 RepID=A0A6A1VEN6_9ROSI|nr:Condensin complex subunit 3 [Morella rubra]
MPKRRRKRERDLRKKFGRELREVCEKSLQQRSERTTIEAGITGDGEDEIRMSAENLFYAQTNRAQAFFAPNKKKKSCKARPMICHFASSNSRSFRLVKLPLEFETKTERELREPSQAANQIRFGDCIWSGVMAEETEEEKQLKLKIAKILDEARTSYATHNRKLKELSAVRSKSSSPHQFFSAFSKTLVPLFSFQRRIASTERIVRFVSVFSGARDPTNSSDCDAFLKEFIRFLLSAAAVANKTARFRACQIISEIIMRLPDDAEVSDELWDEVIDCMMLRVRDKVPLIRTFAVRALSRFANDGENSDILDLFLEELLLEQNAEVRKAILLSLPPSNSTLQVIIECTMDVSESVRKAAYCVLANKFPLQSLSIKLRTIILQRGLADRSPAVSKECLKLMKDEWLIKCCNGDPVELLKYLDVETYELVGDAVMGALLEAGLVNLRDGESILKYMSSKVDGMEGDSVHYIPSIQLIEAEVALYWRNACRHLQSEAQAKGSDAAATMGTEAAVYAAEASDKNDLLERILPATVSDYIDLVKAHIDAGSDYRFASRQLLLLGAMLDFSDATNRKVAGAFVQELLHKPLEHELDDDENIIVIGDGINLGGDREWANAVSGLVKKVHAANGEFEAVVLRVVEELARPCRERTADVMQWMHSLALTGLVLENARSFGSLQGQDIEPTELLQSLLLPGAKHAHLDVQRIAVRCLGLFGLLEKKPNQELVKQLRRSFVHGPPAVSVVACKALIDLGMWHGTEEVDRAVGENFSLEVLHEKKAFSPVNFSDTDELPNVQMLDLLYAAIDKDDGNNSLASDEYESVQAILGEGFAKILLLSENYPSIPASLHPFLLAKLISLYFSNERKELQRLKQCLSVFFEHYPSLSATHKASDKTKNKCLSKAFIPVMRSMWPGINGSAGCSTLIVSNMRKRAVQASRFMLQMMQAPLYEKETAKDNEEGNKELPEVLNGSLGPPLECGEEGLAICIAVEVASSHAKKTAAERTYVSALCRILVMLHFRLTEQGAIKLMRCLLNLVAESVLAEKDLLKELKRMAEHLKAVDRQPEQKLLPDQANTILGRLDLDFNLDIDGSVGMPQTPAPRSTRAPRSRRRVRVEEASSDEEVSPDSMVPTVAGTIGTRSQRASKTAALSKMTASTSIMIGEDDDGEEGSEVTSEEDSDESDQYSECLG